LFHIDVGFFANTVFCKCNWLAQEFCEMLRDWGQAVLLDALTFGTSQVRRKNYARAMLGCEVDGRQRGADAVSSSTLPSLIGTLKSTRIKTRFAFQIEIPN